MSSTSLTTSTTDPSGPAPRPGDAGPDGGDHGVVHRVADEAPAQAARVVDDAKAQLSGAAQRSLADVRTHAEDRTSQAARGLRDLSAHVDALVTGRPDEAGNVTGIAQAVGQHAAEFADRLDADGLQGVVDDVSRFGRRHPWAFLGLSVGAGFLVGRLVRTTAAVSDDEQAVTPHSSSADTSARGNGRDESARSSARTGASAPGFAG